MFAFAGVGLAKQVCTAIALAAVASTSLLNEAHSCSLELAGFYFSKFEPEKFKELYDLSSSFNSLDLQHDLLEKTVLNFDEMHNSHCFSSLTYEQLQVLLCVAVDGLSLRLEVLQPYLNVL